MTDKVIERIDIHGRILWLPALAPDDAVAYRALLDRLLIETPDWNHAAEALDMRGINLTLKVNHHGAQDYMIWSLGSPRAGSWAAARLAEIEGA